MKKSWILAAASSCFAAQHVQAQEFVPGTGRLISVENFEQNGWTFIPNLPKSVDTLGQDLVGTGQTNLPAGTNTTGTVTEGLKRGHPDVVKQVELQPQDGVQGNRYALMLQSVQTGIAGKPSFEMQQDDLVFVKQPINTSQNPSYSIRVFLPEFSQWEQRQGSAFGIRVVAQSEPVVAKPEPNEERGRLGRLRRGRPASRQAKSETYWPGIFIMYHPATAANQAYASFELRGDSSGANVALNKYILAEDLGWWTFGLSFDQQGMVHYYGKKGTQPFVAADRLHSLQPYGFKAASVSNIFVNVLSADDGKTWSTPWIVDNVAQYAR